MLRNCRLSRHRINSAPRQCVGVLNFMKMNGTRLKRFAFCSKVNACAPVRRAHAAKRFSQELTEEATMSRVKQTSKQKRTTKAAAVKVLGAAGLSFSLVGNAS